jgi:hypothetical protein
VVVTIGCGIIASMVSPFDPDVPDVPLVPEVPLVPDVPEVPDEDAPASPALLFALSDRQATHAPAAIAQSPAIELAANREAAMFFIWTAAYYERRAGGLDVRGRERRG